MNDPNTNNQDSTVPSEIAGWFTQRPKWLQVAAKRLPESGNLDDSDISELAELCQQEVNDEFPDLDCSISSEFFRAHNSEEIRLCSISGVAGVNKLAPRESLDFGESNIAVIYGGNGSGKSGYVRLLKHICGARDCIRGQLHGDVFSEEEVAQKAVISFLKGSTREEYQWTGSGVCDALCSVEIFDTWFGQMFKGNDGEVSYEPPVLFFFSKLINVCDRVAAKLDANANALVSRMPSIPLSLHDSIGVVWVKKLSANTSPDEIETHCSFTAEDKIELQDRQRRVSETFPADKAEKLRTRKGHADNLVEELQTCLNELSDGKCQEIIAANRKLILKELAAKAAAENAFSDAKLDGVGSPVWKELWNAARKYSEELAYVGQEFPHVQDDAVCVLCHQSLKDEEAKQRFISFEFYIKEETQIQAQDAAEEVKQLIDALPKILSADTLKAKIDAAGIEDQSIIKALNDTVNSLRDRKSKMQSLESEDGLNRFNQSPKWIKKIREISQGYEDIAKKYETDAESDNRSELRRKMKDLQAKKWLSEQKPAIQEEINRLIEFDRIQEAKKKANTGVLSTKKGELSERLITEALVRRFNNEVNNLRASRLKVKLVKSKTSKGKVIHNIQLDGAGHDLNEILSEGEKHAVSIAAFLADVTGMSYPSSLVFDDPTSSLDQDYEEAVVQRLCAISSERQVIIFTHRLPLLGLVQEYAEKVKTKPKIICIRSESWGTGEPGDPSFDEPKPDRSLNHLINNRLPKAKKNLSESGVEDYRTHAKALCRDFRILLERMIEWRLLSGVVQRHRRAIQTKGKIEHLAKISKADCTYFDDLMTKYSRYEHSQSPEAPVRLPEPDELETDFRKLKEWQSGFKRRPNPSLT